MAENEKLSRLMRAGQEVIIRINDLLDVDERTVKGSSYHTHLSPQVRDELAHIVSILAYAMEDRDKPGTE